MSAKSPATRTNTRQLTTRRISQKRLGSPGFTALKLAIVNLLNDSRYHTEIYSENLETTLFPDEATQRRFRETYALKYRDRKPDVIIALGPTPLRWIAEPGGTFFPETPVVFWGLEGFEAHP